VYSSTMADLAAVELLSCFSGFAWSERPISSAGTSLAFNAGSAGGASIPCDALPIATSAVASPVGCPSYAAGALIQPLSIHPLPLSPPHADDITLGEMVGALKRKVIELEVQRQGAVRNAETLEQELVVEKREHQRATIKLSQVLSKRAASGAEPAHESELSSLRRANAMLRQELASAQQQVRAGAGLAAESLTRDAANANLENAQPRLQKPRNADEATTGTARPGPSTACLPLSRNTSVADVSAPVAAEPEVIPPAIGMVRSISTSLRTPHGYVHGAICVEAPRRQRLRSSALMPRSQSVGMPRSLSGIPLSRFPTAPGELEVPKDP